MFQFHFGKRLIIYFFPLFTSYFHPLLLYTKMEWRGADRLRSFSNNRENVDGLLLYEQWPGGIKRWYVLA